MAEEEAGAEEIKESGNEEKQNESEGEADSAKEKEKEDDKKEKKGKKRNSKMKARMQKKREELQKKKEMMGIPWGPDPCLTMRVAWGKQLTSELTSIKGSQFPWFVPPRKYKDVKDEQEMLYEMERKATAGNNIQRFKDSNERFLKYLYLMSEKVQRQRKWEANRPLGSEMTYKEYLAKTEIRRQKMELQRHERERAAQIEDKVERKLKRQEEGTQDGKKKKKISKLKLFPRWYPMTVIPEFVYTLKLIEKENNKPEACKKEKNLRLKKKTVKDNMVNELTSFLDDLRTVTDTMKLARLNHFFCSYEETEILEELIL